MEMTSLERNLIELAKILSADGIRYGAWSFVYRELKDCGLVSDEAYQTIYRMDTGWRKKPW